MSVVGSISIKDNVSAVLRTIRKEQAGFRKDVTETKKKLKDTWGKKYNARIETTAAMQKMKNLKARLEPMRNKLVKVVAIKDIATEKVKKIASKLKSTGKMIARPVVSIAVKGMAALNGVGKAVGKSAKIAGIGIAGIGVAGAAALKGIYSGAEDAAKAQIEAETKLTAVLGNVASIKARGAGAAKEAKKELMGVASELQGVGVIGDEVTLAGMQQLATFQLSEKEISTLASGMTDLLAQQKGLNATQEDAVGIGNLIGKAMNGQAGALSRVGITFTDVQKKALDTGTSEQRAAVLAKILHQNVGGVNKALAKTDQGKIQQVANAYGDMKEEVGKVVLSIKAKLAAVVMKNIPLLQKLGVSLMKGFDAFSKRAVPVIGKVIKTVIPIVSGMFSKIGTIIKAMSPIIAKAFSGFSGAAKNIKPVFDTVVTGFVSIMPQLSTFATALVTAVMQISEAAVPVITGIVGTIQEILPVIIPVLQTVIQTVTSVITAAAPIIEGMISGISTVVKTLAPVFKKIFDSIGNKVESVISVIGDNMGFIQEVIETVSPIISDVISTAWDVISPVLDVMISTFRLLFSVVQTIFPGIQKCIETVWGVIKPIVEGIGGVMSKIAGWFGNVADAITGSGAGDSEIGENATGDNNWKGGLTWVGEKGPELVDLPKGSRILPNKESVSVSRGLSAGAPSSMRKTSGGENGGIGAIISLLSQILGKITMLNQTPGKEMVTQSSGKNLSLTIEKIADVIQVKDKEEADELTDMVAKKVLEVVLNMP